MFPYCRKYSFGEHQRAQIFPYRRNFPHGAQNHTILCPVAFCAGCPELFCRECKTYLLFIASTGLREAATQAGIRPARRPITVEMSRPHRILPAERVRVKLSDSGITNTPRSTRRIPITPPAMASRAASVRNCTIITYFFAPRAF